MWSPTGDKEIKHGRELTYTRTRKCDNPPPSGGKNCEGSNTDNRTELRELSCLDIRNISIIILSNINGIDNYWLY